MKSLFELLYDSSPNKGEKWTNKNGRAPTWHIMEVEEGLVYYTLFPDTKDYLSCLYKPIEDFMKVYEKK
jgi:hypothetical protein